MLQKQFWDQCKTLYGKKVEIFKEKILGGMHTKSMLKVKTYFHVQIICKITGICGMSVETEKNDRIPKMYICY